VPIVHSGAYGAFLSALRLELRRDAEHPRELELQRLELQQLPVAADVPSDAAAETTLEAWRPEPSGPLGFVPNGLPRRSALGGDSALGDLFCDAVRRATGADVVLLNSSALRADLESGALLRSDLELAMPFEEPWLEAWVTGRELRSALERAAAHSAGQDCVSSLQISGLGLALHCGACRVGGSDCLEVTRDFALGAVRLRDDDTLRLVLPQYLAAPGADFEALARAGAELELSVVDETVRAIAAQPRRTRGEACEAALRSWPLERCREAFGTAACPLADAAAHSNCQDLPELLERRDDRIAMWP
jgi:2',3'-cyclic-nucleotide 2'-phosphodiesterase (5'-nucleotidase family)